MAYLRLPFLRHCEFFFSLPSQISRCCTNSALWLVLFVFFIYIYYFGTNFSSIHTPFTRISMKNGYQSINNNHEDKKTVALPPSAQLNGICTRYTDVRHFADI